VFTFEITIKQIKSFDSLRFALFCSIFILLSRESDDGSNHAPGWKLNKDHTSWSS